MLLWLSVLVGLYLHQSQTDDKPQEEVKFTATHVLVLDEQGL